MKRAFLLFAVLAVVAACGCTEVLNGGTSEPTLGSMPTAEPLPTAESLPTAAPIPTAEPIPTVPASPTGTPVPRDASDPIVGTWSFVDDSGNLTSYDFMSDGTFARHDSNAGTAYTGVWERKGPETYQLIYDTGHSTVTVTYSPSASRISYNDTYYTRV